jgi:hypothetical protein
MHAMQKEAITQHRTIAAIVASMCWCYDALFYSLKMKTFMFVPASLDGFRYAPPILPQPRRYSLPDELVER